jgi:hypothetical protein
VSIDGDELVTGAPRVHGIASNTGAAYTFDRTGTVWAQTAKLVASDGSFDDEFGVSVSIRGDTVAVGASYADAVLSYAGAAYIYQRAWTSWSEVFKLQPHDPQVYNRFGQSVSVGADVTIVGAPGTSVGTNIPAGSAYVFALPPLPYAPYCFGDASGTPCPCANAGASGHGCDNSLATSGGYMYSTGVASVAADTVQLTAMDMLPTVTVVFLQGENADPNPNGSVLGDGLHCIGGNSIRLSVKHASGGAATYPVTGDPSVSVKGLIPATGATRYYQVLYRDNSTFCTVDPFNLTNGIRIAWTP